MAKKKNLIKNPLGFNTGRHHIENTGITLEYGEVGSGDGCGCSYVMHGNLFFDMHSFLQYDYLHVGSDYEIDRLIGRYAFAGFGAGDIRNHIDWGECRKKIEEGWNGDGHGKQCPFKYNGENENDSD